VTAQVSRAGVEDRLRDIQAITDAALSRLGEHALLAELLERARAVLRADTAAVLLLDFASGELVATAAAGLEEEVRQGVRVPVGRGFAGRIAAGHRPVILDRVDHDTVLNPILWAKGIRSLVGVPLIAGGKVVGVLHVGSLTPRVFTGEDVELLQLAADRAATAVQSLPQAAPRRPPATRRAAVTGSGLPAAVIMGRMRSALRAYALETSDPAEVLAKLDAKMQHFEPGALATVAYAVFDPGLDRVHLCSAGHYPPIIAAAGRPAHLAEVPAGLLIGAAPGARRPVATAGIGPGTLVCFYTDGLIERRGRPIEDGLALLCQAVTAQPPDAACAAVMAALVGGEPARDDIALLMFWRPPADLR
jgi:phosphoserine phosphatase RsbU/P